MIYGKLCQSISWEGNEVKLKPLQQFICDECGGLIKKVDDGWLEWIDDSRTPIHGFRIVHAQGASPRLNQGGNCYYPKSFGASDMHLKYFTGPDGLSLLLSFFAKENTADPNELVAIIRRIHLPYYEEARPHLEKALDAGIISSREYIQEELKTVIKEYGRG
jgi:hypothetical protein